MAPLKLKSSLEIAFILCTFLIQVCFCENLVSADEECKHSCASKGCLYRANMLLYSMKPDIDPCQDFYGFACGGYMEKFGKEDTKTVYDDTWYGLQILIKDLLDNLQPAEDSASTKLKVMYDTCMNDESSEIRAVPEALDFLEHVGILNWPKLDANFEFLEPDLSEVLGRLASYQEFAFISFKQSPYGDKRTNGNSLPSALILPDMFLLNSKLNPKDVKNTVLKILAYFKVNEDDSIAIWKNFEAIENIGIKLQNEVTENSGKCKGGSRNVYAKLNCSEENEGSMTFLCNLWKSTIRNGNLSQHFSEDIIHISCRWNQYYYVENIFSNLANLTQRTCEDLVRIASVPFLNIGNPRHPSSHSYGFPRGTKSEHPVLLSLADYLVLRFFFSHIDDLNMYFHLTKKAFSGVKGSKHKTTHSINRWEYCIGWIIKSLNLVLGYEYSQEVLTRTIQNHILEIIQEYVEEMNKYILEQNWINERVKVYLKNQLIKLEIGFGNTMEKYRNKTFVENYYKEFHPTKESFFKNILEYKKVSVVMSEKDKAHFSSFFSSSDPYTMDFGMALFLPPTYSYGVPKLWNYAALGWVIGHELSHNLKLLLDVVHLDSDTENKLTEKIDCYVQQYSQFLMERIGRKKISKEAEEEITADNIGWTLTENILQKYLEDTMDEVHLPGVDYTSKQLMYISFAQACCEVLSSNVENELYNSNPQNLEKLRILGVLQNSKNFSSTFNCSADSIMNPANKCAFLE